MKKIMILAAALLIVLLAAGVSFAGPHGGHHGGGHHGGGHWHGGFGFWGGGLYIGAPGIYVGGYPYYSPYYYTYPAACTTRCYRQVVPTCSTNIEGEQTCTNQVVRTCRRYCY